MKKYILCFLALIFIVSCTQKPAKIVYNDKNIYDRNYYQSDNYYKGTHKVSPTGRTVRDLRMEQKENSNETPETVEENITTSSNSNLLTVDKTNYNNYSTPNTNYLNDTYTVITVNQGENLFRIAKNNNVPFQDLATLNNIREPYSISVGQQLKLPKTKMVQDTPVDNTTVNIPTQQQNNDNYHIVRQGETAYSISKMYKLDLKEFARMNNFVEPYVLSINQQVVVKNNQVASAKQVTSINNVSNDNSIHSVRQGETAYSIAKMYKLDLKEFAQMNNFVEPYVLSINQQVVVKNNQVAPNNVSETTSKVVVAKENKIETKVEPINKQPEVVENNTTNEEYTWPIKGEILVKFGDKIEEKIYDGISIKGKTGSDIKVAKAGEIAYAGNELKGYGNIVIVRHANNWLTIYAHCDTLKVKVKDKVKQGDVIATIGSTGSVTTPQLYFSIREGRTSVDPLLYLK